MADAQSLPQALCYQLFPFLAKHVSSFSNLTFSLLWQSRESSAPVMAGPSPFVPKWKPRCHPRVEAISQEVNEYFLQHWQFPSTKAKKKFFAADFSKVTCLYFPLAKDDRIHLACRLLSVLFLIDDALEEMSFVDGEVYNERLIQISRGDISPDRKTPFRKSLIISWACCTGTVPVEYILHDLWEGMRVHDKELADAVLEPTFTFMRAQTDRSRTSLTELRKYLEYREKDVGKA